MNHKQDHEHLPWPPADQLHFRAATLADTLAIHTIEFKSYSYLGEGSIVPPALIASRIELLNSGKNNWFLVGESAGQVVSFIVMQPTAVDPETYASWDEATDEGRLVGTYVPEGPDVYFVAAGRLPAAPSSYSFKTAHNGIDICRGAGKKRYFLAAAIPGFDQANQETGITVEDYWRATREDGRPLDWFMNHVFDACPEAVAERLMPNGYATDRLSHGFAVSFVASLTDDG